jgi:hypothetical protein
MIMKQSIVAVLLAAASFVGLCLASQAETVIVDQFGTRDRVVGGPLNRNATESGSAIWEATSNVQLDGQGAAEIVNSYPFMGRVNLREAAEVITVEARLRPFPPESKNNWLAIGIGNPALGTPPWGKGVFLTINSQETWGCLVAADPHDAESKSAKNVERGAVWDVRPDGWYLLKLQYDTKNNTVSAWINDKAIMEEVSLDGKGVTIEPRFAGFSGYGQQAGVQTVSDFKVTCRP